MRIAPPSGGGFRGEPVPSKSREPRKISYKDYADKVPPNSVDAEESLLSAILNESQTLLSVVEIVKPEDFYHQGHAMIFEAMLELFNINQPVDIVTVHEHLAKKKQVESVGGATSLARLVDEVPLAVNAPFYAQIIREKAILRGLINASHGIIHACHEASGDVPDLMDWAESEIFKVTEKRSRESVVPMDKLITRGLAELSKRSRNRALVTGVPTGFSRLDQLTSGFQPSDLIILAARPGMGKTALALNIARNAALEGGFPVLIFSLEMSNEQLAIRMLCSEARVDSTRVRGGFLSGDDHDKLVNAGDKLFKAPIYIDDSPVLTALEVRAKARRLKKNEGLGLIIIDYLQLMKGPPKIERRELEISDISRSLKALAKELSVPVVALSQLNRKVEERSDKRPQLSDLRESGALEQDADVILFIYREAAYSQEEAGGSSTGPAEVKIAKQRNGPTGKLTLTYMGEYTRFEDAAGEP